MFIMRKREILPVNIQKRRGGGQKARIWLVVFMKPSRLGFTKRFDEP